MLIEDIDFLSSERAAPQKKGGRAVTDFWARFRPGTREPAFSRREVRLFASALASLLEGGIPLLKALEVLGRESGRSLKRREILARITGRVRQGSGFSQALEKEPRSFPSYFVQMAAAGELSGNLVTVLRLLAVHLEKDEERRRRIVEAAAYPCIVLSLGAVTFAVLLKFVIPKIASVYEDFGGELPGITRFVLALSRMFLPLTAAAMITSAAGIFFLRRHRHQIPQLLIRLPAAGPLLARSLLAKFAALLALELKSGIPVLAALDSVRMTVSWNFFQGDLLKARQGLAQGGLLADSMRSFVWVPESACVLLQAGQEAGRLPEALEQIGREASADFETQVQFVLKILEPVLIVGVGGLVGFIVLSAILPILEMNTLVR